MTRETKKKFHPENSLTLSRVISKILSWSQLYNLGFANAQKIKLQNVCLGFAKLPREFDGYKFLFISDLHIDGFLSLAELVWQRCADLEYECLILGGDYRFRVAGNPAFTYKQLRWLIPRLVNKTPVYAVLGNHDDYELGLELEKMGVQVLLNESIQIFRGKQSITVVGLDDGHYYNSADFELAESQLQEAGFRMLISHSPEFYQEAAERKYDLMLSGHTHAGQICLPGKIILVKEAPVPYHLLSGQWQYQNLQGYTSSGVGCSMVPVRFNCQPEIVQIVLQRAEDPALLK
ncbi:MAG: metallophosphoesterase [Candidatus Cloacimonadales bacterium]